LGSIIPTADINPAAAGILQYVPLPNLPGTVQNYQLQTTVPVQTDSVNAHVLHTINSKFNLNVGYNFNSVRQHAISSFLDFGSHSSTRNQNVTLGLVQNWSPQVGQQYVREFQPQPHRSAQRPFLWRGHCLPAGHHRRFHQPNRLRHSLDRLHQLFQPERSGADPDSQSDLPIH
jgi:hypothetical protein